MFPLGENTVWREDLVLQGMTDGLTETERCCGMEINAEKTEVMRISREPSPLQIIINQKQLDNVAYFNYRVP
jgi:hypothetical protein